MGEREPSDVLQDFLNYIDRCKTRMQTGSGA